MNHDCGEGLRTEKKILFWNGNWGIYNGWKRFNRDSWHLTLATLYMPNWALKQRPKKSVQCSNRRIYVRLFYIWLNQFDVCTMVVCQATFVFFFIFPSSLNLTTVKFMFLHYYLFIFSNFKVKQKQYSKPTFLFVSQLGANRVRHVSINVSEYFNIRRDSNTRTWHLKVE